jgi:hypothetical protein
VVPALQRTWLLHPLHHVGPTGIVYVTDYTDGTLYVAGSAPTVLCEVAIDRRSQGAETPAKKTAAKR